MDIARRTQNLVSMIQKEAALKAPKLDSIKPPKAPKAPKGPKLEGINKPPSLTPPSQPKLDIIDPKPLPKLPKMKVDGPKAKFNSRMNDNNPYKD